MRCVILCGGKGERLAPITKNVKKAFLPLGEKQVIDHIIGRLPNGMSYSVSVNDNGAIASLEEVAKGDEPVMVVCGDNYFSSNLDSFVAAFNGETLIGVAEVKTIEIARQCGVVELHRGSMQVKSLAEKPEQPLTKLVSAGLYIFPPSVFTCIHNLAVVSPKGNIGNVISHIIATRPVYGFHLQGVWIDIGTHECYEAAIRFENMRLMKASRTGVKD